MRPRGWSVAFGPSSADEASRRVDRIGRLSHDDARDSGVDPTYRRRDHDDGRAV